MVDSGGKSPGLWVRLSRWVAGHWSREVPNEIASCEFECNVNECQEDDWIRCQRRIAGAVGAESMREPSGSKS
jgi:hypothetical protein